MVQIAILGLGTVGTGVAKVVMEHAARIEKKLGEPLNVKSVLVRRFQDGPYRHLMTDDFSVIEQDPEICAVVETIGGTDAAYTYTKRALCAGKHVITANKQLVAEHGQELLQLARKHHVRYLFEASVGGGIPVLHPLTQCLAANDIDEVYGILNGTTNYILTKMVNAGASFTDALREAQEKGYAEADPSADVDGIDAGRKICILADLAFGRWIDPAAVPMEGISELDLKDVRTAGKAGYRVRLLGRAVRVGERGCSAYVAPHLLPVDHPMAAVQDVFNAILVHGDAVDDVMFYGRGAGAQPTASACISDVLEALRAEPAETEDWTTEQSEFVSPCQLLSRYYFRIEGTPADAEQAFGQVEVLDAGAETAFLTEVISGREAQERGKGLNVRASFRVLS